MSFSESARLLIAAGATVTEQDWIYVLVTDETELLQLILEHRWILPPETLSRSSSTSQRHGKAVLKLPELRGLLCAALDRVHYAACWLPLLIRAGVEPSLLLQGHM